MLALTELAKSFGQFNWERAVYRSNKALVNHLTNHIWENLIGLGCHDDDNWIFASEYGSVFLTDIAIDQFNWWFITFKTRDVIIYLSMIAKSEHESSRVSVIRTVFIHNDYNCIGRI